MQKTKEMDLFEEAKVRTEKFIIGPDLAKKWIARNSKANRHISPARVDQYARDMKDKKWQLNGESVKFSKGGSLVDGQHRLLACIQAGISFETNVTFGLEEDAIFTIDSNMVRTTAQMLRMQHGTVNAGSICSALAWLWRYEQAGGKLTSRERAPSRHETLSLLLEHQGVEQSVTKVKHLNLAATGLMAFCHYVFSRQDQLLADAFFDALESGENMKGGDPVFMLRERLLQNRMNKARLPVFEICALMFKAWQATKTGKPIKQLRYSVQEEFPLIQDDLKTGTMWRGPARAAIRTAKAEGAHITEKQYRDEK